MLTGTRDIVLLKNGELPKPSDDESRFQSRRADIPAFIRLALFAQAASGQHPTALGMTSNSVFAAL
jgi:hypothetical protein